MSSHPVIWSPR